MILLSTGLIILIIYTLSLLGLAYYASLQDKKNIKDFATAGSSLGILLLTLTFSATYHSAYAFLGAAGYAYKNGIGWWVNGIWTVFPGVLFWILGRRFWFLGKKYGYISLPQFLNDVYQDNKIGFTCYSYNTSIHTTLCGHAGNWFCLYIRCYERWTP